MDSQQMINYSLEYGIAIGLSIIYLLVYISMILVRYARYTEFSRYIQSLSTDEWRNRCIDHVVDKINVTNTMVDKRLAADEVVAQCIYNHDAVRQLGQEMKGLFSARYKIIMDRYPLLSELDLLVLALLAIDLSNGEICSVLRMEKRTLYRRRQLIAQRMETSSTELESLATEYILGEGENL